MSKIDNLIKQYCPNGVEYKTIKEIAEIGTGSSNRVDANKDGLYPFFVRSKDVLKINDFEFDEEAIIIPGEGGIGDIFHYIKGKYALHQRAYRIHFFIKELNVKFAYYYMIAQFKSFIFSKAVNATVTSIRKPMIEKFKLPIPPLPVQEEIVKVLDAFTALEAELEAELEARKRQYEYYRNKLLTFDENTTEGGRIKFMQLGEVCNKVSTIKWKNNQDKEYKYIDLSSLNRNNNTIEDAMVITNDNAPSRAQQIVKKDDVLFGTTRPTLRRYCIIPNEYNNQICSTGYCVLRADTNIIIPQYLFFMLTTNSFYNYVEEKQSGASYPSISDTLIKKYIIPVPPLEEQERIVAILDKFDSLVNDISEGLPAELTARRQQYEYYRNKLLTFDEAA